MLKDAHWCFEPVVGLGYVRFPKIFNNGKYRYPDSVKTIKAATTKIAKI